MTIRCLLSLLMLPGSYGRGMAQPPARDYLPYVRSFADSLLKYGLDRYGPRTTAQWASVIDTRTGQVPRRDVPTIAGVRPGDRAVGGSNVYQDVETIRAFRVLSNLTGDSRYRQAADDYLRDVLRYTQSPQTGLLGWGEHLYYDLYQDRVRVDTNYARYGNYYHEFLADTPPWKELWAIDSVRTRKAVEGLKYHFYRADTDDFLFNRHAYWQKTEYQPPAVSQPWIKHSGLQAYSFLFLYHQTSDSVALRQAKGSSWLYWNHRNPQTNLTPSCIGDPRPEAQGASLSGTASLAYFLVKSSGWAPSGWNLNKRAATLLAAAERYCWDETRQTYRVGFDTDGKAAPSASKRTHQTHLTAWTSGYGTSNLFDVGRLAANCALLSPDPVYRRLAERCAEIARREPAPDTLIAENVGDAIHLNLDLYALTGKPAYRQAADDYAQLAIRHLWRNGWFVRQTDDAYYEAKLGIGTLVLGLLRLQKQQQTSTAKPASSFTYDWSK